jgi:hypothetical protein
LRRSALVVLLTSLFALAAAAPSSAEGGGSIAGAPLIVPGQQEFGSLLAHPPMAGTYWSWWLLPLTAGDAVQIDWEGQYKADWLGVYPPGTNDFNLSKASTVAHQDELDPNLKAETTYQAAESGTYPLAITAYQGCCFNPSGPYNLTVYITHALSVALPRVGALHSRGALTISVHNPEGGAISAPTLEVQLEVDLHGAWRTIGSAPVANSAAVVHYRLSPHLARQRVAMRAVAHGPEYATTDSTHAKVTLP